MSFHLATVVAGPAWGSPVVLNQDARNMHLMLYNKSTTAIVEYSFDGVALDGELDPADGTRGKAFDNRSHASISFRIKAGSVGPAIVSCESWQGGYS